MVMPHTTPGFDAYTILPGTFFAVRLLDLYEQVVGILHEIGLTIEEKISKCGLLFSFGLKMTIRDLLQENGDVPHVLKSNGFMMALNMGNNTHWVLVVFNFLTWTCYVYDSSKTPVSDLISKLKALGVLLLVGILLHDTKCMPDMQLGKD